MSIEIELKLSLAPEHLDRLKRHPYLRSLSTARAVSHQLYNVYFDTPQLELSAQRMALRLRRVGKQWLQTLKGGGSVQAGLHSRNEWEAPVAGEALDFDALKNCGGQLPHGVHKRLTPVFVTDFSRSMRLVRFEGAEIEIALDGGEIRAQGKTQAISELELELKSGDPEQLFRFALTLLDIVPLQIEQTNKAQYGYRLWLSSMHKQDVDPVAVSKARHPQLTHVMDMKEALQQLLWSAMQHLQANVPGAIKQLDEEYLHQVRVALRRLRVLLSLAAKWHDDSELNILRGQLAKLASELGHLREWDVFVTQTLPPIHARLTPQHGLTDLIGASNEMRAQLHIAVRNKLNSPDFQRLLLRFGAWMYGGYWQQAVTRPSSLSDFAKLVLAQRGKQVEKRGKLIEGGDASRLHQFRIACKKLRYSAEMFSGLLGESKHYLAALSELQEITGRLNDITVAGVLLRQLESTSRHETITMMRGWLEHDYANLSLKLGKAQRRFSEQSPCWH